MQQLAVEEETSSTAPASSGGSGGVSAPMPSGAILDLGEGEGREGREEYKEQHTSEVKVAP